MFIENLLGTKAKVKIVRVLAESRTAYSLKNLRNETELSLGILHKALQELVEEGIVLKIKGEGKERLFKFNTENAFSHEVFELFKIEKTLQRKETVFLHTWNVLESVVAKIRHKAALIALFGSQARGDATLRSDIDILVIPIDAHQEVYDDLHAIKSKNKINATVMRMDAFKEVMKNNTLFYKNIKSDAIILTIKEKAKEDLAAFLEDIHYIKKERV